MADSEVPAAEASADAPAAEGTGTETNEDSEVPAADSEVPAAEAPADAPAAEGTGTETNEEAQEAALQEIEGPKTGEEAPTTNDTGGQTEGVTEGGAYGEGEATALGQVAGATSTQTGEQQQQQPQQTTPQPQQETNSAPALASNAITVDFFIAAENYTHQESFHAHETVWYMKEVLAEKFKVHPSNIELQMGSLLEDAQPVSYYRPVEWVPGQTIQIKMVVLERNNQPQAQDYIMPDVIEVSAGPNPDDPNGPDQVVLIKIIRENLHRDKPFLGGFRHKGSGKVYHHGSTQTVRKRRNKGVPKNSRETQTVEVVTRSQQTNREQGTQMDRKDLYLDHTKDSVLFARKYFTAHQMTELRDQMSCEIQCFLRQCFAWRRVRRLREARYGEEFKSIADKEAKDKQTEIEHKRQIERRMRPRTKQDFDILYQELEAWRQHETMRIKASGASKDEIHFRLEELLGKEVKLLQTIDRLKITASKENKQSATKEMLEKMASPKEWGTSDGDLVEVQTPFTTRAKELVELYNGLCLSNLPKLQRVDVLLHVKYTVKEFDCDLTRDIVDLIQREEDLLRRGRSDKSMEGLRTRLSNLFLQFIDIPEFNPEAANFQRVPYEPQIPA